MRKVALVLLIVVSLVASLTVSGFAFYSGGPSFGDFVPVPKQVSIFTPGGLWLNISDSPVSLTPEFYSELDEGGSAYSYNEIECGDGFIYVMHGYSLVSVDGVEYLEYSIDFEGLDTGGIISLPVMNNCDIPLLFRVYEPTDSYIEYSVDGRGYNIVGDDLEWENFTFDISTGSDEYINSNIGQMPVYVTGIDSYEYIQFDITFGSSGGTQGSSYGILYPLDSALGSLYHTVDLTDIDIEVIEAPSFLNWLTRSVSAFLDAKIFNIGDVSVTLGVCLLVPLSLYFLVAFLKKFSGG